MRPSLYFGSLLMVVLLANGCASPDAKRTFSDPDAARAHYKQLHSDLYDGRILTLKKAMKLTPEQEEEFRPIYKSYNQELRALTDSRLANLHKFLTHHKGGTLDGQKLNALTAEWLQYLQNRLDLWNKYYRIIGDKVSRWAASEFIRVENHIALFYDLTIASELPSPGESPGKPEGP